METESLEQQQLARDSSIPEDREEIPETFPGHEALPSVTSTRIQRGRIFIVFNP